MYYGYDNVDNFGVTEQDTASALLAASVTHGPSSMHLGRAKAGAGGSIEGVDVGRHGRGHEQPSIGEGKEEEDDDRGDEETGHRPGQVRLAHAMGGRYLLLSR